MSLLLVAVAACATITWVVVAATHDREQQTERGLFGEEAREGLIRRWVATAIDLAERQVRLAYFGDALRTRIWEGTVAEIVRPERSRACTWRFATGEAWTVELATAVPRNARRVVVRAVEHRGRECFVDVYVPGRRDLSVAVLDARPAALERTA